MIVVSLLVLLRMKFQKDLLHHQNFLLRFWHNWCVRCITKESFSFIFCIYLATFSLNFWRVFCMAFELTFLLLSEKMYWSIVVQIVSPSESKFGWQSAEIRIPLQLGATYTKWLALITKYLVCPLITERSVTIMTQNL